MVISPIRSRLSAMSSRQVIDHPRRECEGAAAAGWEHGFSSACDHLRCFGDAHLGRGHPSCGADSVAHLIDVTVRPGYGFGNPDDALAYGQQLCDKV